MGHLIKFSQNVVIGLPVVIVFLLLCERLEPLEFWISYKNFFSVPHIFPKKQRKLSASGMIINARKKLASPIHVLPSSNNKMMCTNSPR